MRKLLLLISDCPETCQSLHESLEDRFNLKIFSDGSEALLYLRSEQTPDLVIVDPEIEGLADWELVRYLHSSRTCRGVPVVVIADRPLEENRHRYFRYRVMDYFQKPIATEQLLIAVDGLLMADAMERIF